MSCGPNASDGAATLSRAIKDKAGGLLGRVTQLGTSLEVEIVDLDPFALEEDVLAALGDAVELTGSEPSGTLRARPQSLGSGS